MARNQPEFRLACLIADMLRLLAKPGVYWAASANGEERPTRAGQRLKRVGVRAGHPDVEIVIKGRFYGLELKAEDGRQSREQREVQALIEAADGRYCLAKGYAEAVAFLVEIGAIRPVTESVRFRPRVAA